MPLLFASAAGSASKSLREASVFAVDHMHGGYAMVECDEASWASHADRLIVFGAPLKKAPLLAVLGDRFRHSVVVMLDSKKGTGWLAEFTNTGVHMQRGRLVVLSERRVRVMLGDKAKKKTIKRFGDLDGLLRCSLSFADFLDFNKRFSASFASVYEVGVFDCHTYHRSLVATALTGMPLFNYRVPLEQPPDEGALPKPRQVKQVWKGSEVYYRFVDGFRVRHGEKEPVIDYGSGAAERAKQVFFEGSWFDKSVSLRKIIKRYKIKEYPTLEKAGVRKLREAVDTDRAVNVQNMEAYLREADAREKERVRAEAAERAAREAAEEKERQRKAAEEKEKERLRNAAGEKEKERERLRKAAEEDKRLGERTAIERRAVAMGVVFAAYFDALILFMQSGVYSLRTQQADKSRVVNED